MITAALLPDGRRLHLQHGPIDLVIEADGEPAAVEMAYRAARECLEGLLDELVAELALLRTPLDAHSPSASRPALAGPVAQCMLAAVWPHRSAFVTPMAAVAGAVADHVLGAMVAATTVCGASTLRRAYVNNGGDIALHLAPGETFVTGIVTRGDMPFEMHCEGPCAPTTPHRVDVSHDRRTRGIATSGWRGRSLSLGIADSVTVLAPCAAAADAAATLIASATDVNSAAVKRAPATTLDERSDLGERLVTVGVQGLAAGEADTALDTGAQSARSLLARGLIDAALISLDGRTRLVDSPSQRIAA